MFEKNSAYIRTKKTLTHVHVRAGIPGCMICTASGSSSGQQTGWDQVCRWPYLHLLSPTGLEDLFGLSLTGSFEYKHSPGSFPPMPGSRRECWFTVPSPSEGTSSFEADSLGSFGSLLKCHFKSDPTRRVHIKSFATIDKPTCWDKKPTYFPLLTGLNQFCVPNQHIPAFDNFCSLHGTSAWAVSTSFLQYIAKLPKILTSQITVQWIISFQENVLLSLFVLELCFGCQILLETHQGGYKVCKLVRVSVAICHPLSRHEPIHTLILTQCLPLSLVFSPRLLVHREACALISAASREEFIYLASLHSASEQTHIHWCSQ